MMSTNDTHTYTQRRNESKTKGFAISATRKHFECNYLLFASAQDCATESIDMRQSCIRIFFQHHKFVIICASVHRASVMVIGVVQKPRSVVRVSVGASKSVVFKPPNHFWHY